eukprot:m.130881 g.130881  ORF g.130881 m.130881 type:complete len:637 (+) comp9473_c2_seq1:91-2001(+)
MTFVKSSFIIPLCVAVIGVAVYANSLNGDFVFDDMPAIKDNSDVNPETPWKNVFRNNFWGQQMGSGASQHYSYRPLTTLTFRWNVAYFGWDTFSFHAVNIILHAVASYLITLVAHVLIVGQQRAVTQKERKNESNGTSQTWMVAGIAGVLFAIHPVHTEAVANIVCRAEILSCVFWCLGFLAYAHILLPNRNSSTKKLIAWPLIFLLTVLSVASKEQGIMLLPTLAAVDLIFYGGVVEIISTLICKKECRTASPSTSKDFGKDHTIIKKEKLKMKVAQQNNSVETNMMSSFVRVGILVAIFSVIYASRLTFNSGGPIKPDLKTNPANHIEDFTFRVLNKSYYVFLHSWLLVFPAQLCCDWSSYGVEIIEEWGDYRNVQTLSLLLFLVYTLYLLLFGSPRTRAVRHTCLAALALTITTFLPASGLFLEVGFVVAERVLYLPCAGACIAFAVLCGQLMADQEVEKKEEGEGKSLFKKNTKVLIGVAIVVALMCSRTWIRNTEWGNVISLYKSGLKVLPGNAKLHHNYATSLGHTKEAEYHFRTSIHIYPYYASAYINLGVNLANTNRLSEAVAIWEEGLVMWRKRPIVGNDPSVLTTNLGIANMNLGNYGVARKYFEECLRYDPHKQLCKSKLAMLPK